jgi:large subunit ribosomal protein L7/L12
LCQHPSNIYNPQPYIQSRLNIQEIALPTAGAAFPAAAGAGVGADDAGAGEEEVAAKPKEKTIFNVRLKSFDAKPKVIKEVKALVPNLTLIEVRHPLNFLNFHFTFSLC